MKYVFYTVIFILLGYVIYRNITLIISYRHNREYIECYQQMLEEKENVHEKIEKYIESQNSEEFKNKGRLIKLYSELRDNLDYSKTIDEIDLSKIFYVKDKPSKNKTNINCDSFIWLYLSMGLARNISRFDVLDILNQKIDDLNMDYRLEVKEAKAIYDTLSENDVNGVDFLNDLLQGNYLDYEYDRNLIGLFKRIAACTLAYSGEPLEDYYKEDIRNFASTMIGKNYMKSLEIYEKYLPVIEKEEEEL